MNEKSPHRACQEFLQKLGIALGFDVEMPDIGWRFYSLERVSKGKRPDIIWGFKSVSIPFKVRKNLKLSEPYAIFEVECVTDWVDIKRHLDNIKEMGLEPHVVFAVFYDGMIKSKEKEELTGYARSLGFRLEIVYKQELMNIFGKIINTKTQHEINEIKEFSILCDRIKRLTHSRIFRNAEENSNFNIRSSDIFDGDIESFQRLQLGSCRKIGTIVYMFGLNDYASELISNLGLLCKDKHTFSRIPFFTSICEILQSNIWEKMRDKGVENYVMNIIKLTLHYIDKELIGEKTSSVVIDTYPAALNMRDMKYAIEVSSQFNIWLKIFKGFLKIKVCE